MDAYHPSLRLDLDGDALVANWRWLARQSGPAACGAAIKADGYGLGARAVLDRLAKAGCRDFFVSNWAEAAALMPLADGLSLSVFHGIGESDIAIASTVAARPVLNSAAQIACWQAHFPGRACDVMIDTGMNRLGVPLGSMGDIDLASLTIDTVMSHLACADEDRAMNAGQRDRFAAVRAGVPAARASLANSAGICLGSAYAFDLTRPGLALYGGVPRREAAGHIARVAHPAMQIIQLRDVLAGESVGYGATFTADRDMRIAIVHAGYADGLIRALAPHLVLNVGGAQCRVLGRISMDLIAIAAPESAREGDWAELDYDLPSLAAATPLNQYELLTGLGARWERRWR
ncbi:MAG: alanine racemase [Sphingomonadales bacterium]|nr:alanine racemase [Sphingomonadales bacterium]